MKRNTLFFFSALALITFCLGACKKYDQDGSLIQFRKPEKRLEGTWNVIALDSLQPCDPTVISNLYISNNPLISFEFTDDNLVYAENTSDNLSLDGRWEFNDDKSILRLVFTSYQSPDTLITNQELNVYWEIEELEMEDFQALQFREHSTEFPLNVLPYAWYLRMKKE